MGDSTFYPSVVSPSLRLRVNLALFCFSLVSSLSFRPDLYRRCGVCNRVVFSIPVSRRHLPGGVAASPKCNPETRIAQQTTFFPALCTHHLWRERAKDGDVLSTLECIRFLARVKSDRFVGVKRAEGTWRAAALELMLRKSRCMDRINASVVSNVVPWRPHWRWHSNSKGSKRKWIQYYKSL